MQLTLATAAALVATASASGLQRREEFNYNSTCDSAKGAIAKVVNRCSYPVHIWSIDKQLGCPDGTGLVLEQGAFYHENMRNTTDGGISIKISKYEQCGGNDLTQLEYKLNWESGFEGNFLDISFVDCTSGDCPGWDDGFYFKSGNEDGAFASAVNNEHCPVFSVADAIEAAAVSYVKWDDRQTKWCNADANMALYLCGNETPGSGDNDTPVIPQIPSKQPEQPAAPSKTEVQEKPKPTTPAYTPVESAAPAYTPEVEAAAAPAVTEAPSGPVVKTEVVYETVYVKRHAHGRRHQHFHA